MALGTRDANGHIVSNYGQAAKDVHNPYHLTSDQMNAAISQFTSAPEFAALSERDRHNALVGFIGKMTNHDMSGGYVDSKGGFFQNIPGQANWETLATRIIGAVGMGVVGGEMALGGGAGTGGGGTAAATTGAAGTDTATAAGTGFAGLGEAPVNAAAAADAASATPGLASTATAGLNAGASTLPGVAPSVSSAAFSGASATPSLTSKVTNLGKDFSKLGQAQSAQDQTGINDATTAGTAAANEANQLTKNRFAQTTIDQRGPDADAQSLRNMARAGLIAGMPAYQPTPGHPNYGIVPITPDAQTRAFSGQMRDQLQRRMANGQPLTLSGVPAPTQEELDAQTAAHNATTSLVNHSQTPTATKVANTINTGVQYANLGKDLWSMF